MHMQNQDIVIGILSGDILSFAKNIVYGLNENKVDRILWVTGMGIHHEVAGDVGKMLDELCKKMPEYVEAADLIQDSGIDYTLIRAAHLTDGKNERYYIQHEGETLHANTVDRMGVAKFIKDLIDKDQGRNESIGVTN